MTCDSLYAYMHVLYVGSPMERPSSRLVEQPTLLASGVLSVTSPDESSMQYSV